MKIIKENDKNINDIAAALKNGAVLVLPTDTVYGLVCDATNEMAVERIFSIKRRDKSKTLPVFVENLKMTKKYAVVNEKQEVFLKKNWPGAVTVVLSGKKGLSELVYKDDTIALRQPNYKLIIDIIKAVKKPLAQTSANISDSPAPAKIEEVIGQFIGQDVQPDLVVDAGDLPNNKPSTIIDLTSNIIKVLRK